MSLEFETSPLVSSAIARGFPGEYRETSPQVLSFVRRTQKRPTAEILDKIAEMVMHSLAAPAVHQYRQRAASALPDFHNLVMAFASLHGEAGAGGNLDALLTTIDEWGGEHRVDVVVQSLMVRKRAIGLIQRFEGTALLEGEHADTDLRFARAWASSGTGHLWSLCAAASLPLAHPNCFEIPDAVYDDLVTTARAAYVAVRSAYDLRFPTAAE